MKYVYQYLPFRHAPSLKKDGVHFSKCSEFVDLMEFRFGYLGFQGCDIRELSRKLPSVFSNEHINQLVDSSYVSCWTEDSQERYSMWELYGRRQKAIRIRVDRDGLICRFSRLGFPGVYGSITYQFTHSRIRPEFLGKTGSLNADQDEYYHLFFHKHGFYCYEDEFRLVCFTSPMQLIVEDLVSEVRMSPFAQWTESERIDLQTLFPGKVEDSALEVSYKT